jgi:hypothetical protein
MRRTDYGERRYEARVMIQGHKILLGYYEKRYDAILAMQTAVTVRKALECAAAIKRKQQEAR